VKPGFRLPSDLSLLALGRLKNDPVNLKVHLPYPTKRNSEVLGLLKGLLEERIERCLNASLPLRR
jgi:hypothetical protein